MPRHGTASPADRARRAETVRGPSVPEPRGRPFASYPRLPRTYVGRQALWQQLSAATSNAMTIVVAPAGSGKTLGVAGWLDRVADEQAVWVTATSDLGPTAMSDLLATSSPPPEPAATSSAPRDRVVPPEPRLVVVDDAHLLPSATVAMLDDRLNTDPEKMRLLLLAAWDVPLTQLVPELLGHLTVIRGDVLRMDRAEVAELVLGHTGTDDDVVVDAVMKHTRGWCAASVLAARALGSTADPHEAATTYPGEKPISDVVAGEAFAALTTRERLLLLCVTAESALTASTARKLTRDPLAGDTLAGLEATGLLVTRDAVSSPDAEPVYHIHPMLLEVVRRRVVAGGVDVERARASVLRAVQLDVSTGEIDLSFRRLVSIGAYDDAARMLPDLALPLLERNRRHEISDFARQHPATVGRHPHSWMTIALDHWLAGDIQGVTHWTGRVVEHFPVSPDENPSADAACARLLRSRIGLEPVSAAAGHGRRVLLRLHRTSEQHPLLPLLTLELGVAQNWLGDLGDAESNLTTAVMLSRTGSMPSTTAEALSHLALNQYMQGREPVCLSLAAEGLQVLEHLPGDVVNGNGVRAIRTRLQIAEGLATSQDIPWPQMPAPVAEPLQPEPVDLTGKFWARVLRSRTVLGSGSLFRAGQLLDSPLETPSLPDHLQVALLVERSMHSFLGGDRTTLAKLGGRLAELAARGEAALVAGLRAELVGDLTEAEDLFGTAAMDATYPQPATMILALCCRAQVLDALGAEQEALEVLDAAVSAASSRRCAAPFVGLSVHGSALGPMLARLTTAHPTGFGLELAAATATMPSLSTLFASVTATPREALVDELVLTPMLSPREREVLHALARGGTYSDVAADLFVSENTVKTHVSSLYAKLGAGRRSEALAVARKMHLL